MPRGASSELITLLEAAWVRPANWREVEERLGYLLPADFKTVAETFGTGVFGHGVQMFSPVDGPNGFAVFVDESAQILNLARAWAASGVVPYSLHPQPGGLIPWGRTRAGTSLFWRTDGAGPDEWTVVCCDNGFTRWEEHPLSVSGFLLAFMTGQLTSDLLGGRGPDERTGDPVFTPPPSKHRPDPSLDGAMWQALFEDVAPEVPLDRTADIRSITGVGSAGRRLDWPDLATRLGVALPSDYRALVDHFGPGEFRGVRVVAPGVRDEFGLFPLLREVKERVAKRRPVAEASYRPVPGGAVPWAYTESGHVLFWAAVRDDPDEWPVFVVLPGFGEQVIFSRSASSLLLAHLTGDVDVAAVLSVDAGRPFFRSGQN